MSIFIRVGKNAEEFAASITHIPKHIYRKVDSVRVRGRTLKCIFLRIKKQTQNITKRFLRSKGVTVIIQGLAPHNVLLPLTEFLYLSWREVVPILLAWTANPRESWNPIINKLRDEIQNISLQLRRVDEIQTQITELFRDAEQRYPFDQDEAGQLIRSAIAKYQEASEIFNRISSSTEQLEREQDEIMNTENIPTDQFLYQRKKKPVYDTRWQQLYSENVVLKARIAEELAMRNETEQSLQIQLKNIREEKDMLEKKLIVAQNEIPSPLKRNLIESKASLAVIWSILESIRTTSGANHHDIDCVAQANTLSIYPM